MTRRRINPQTAFGIIDRNGYVYLWSIGRCACDVRSKVGYEWDKENPSQGWQEALDEGLRAVKIELNPIWRR